ncbi:MAG: hypothetical protein RMK29_12965 [Myxococcales bacterium]|nr:hypothetical protein [Myxococcota bacterium]MDW8282616.1 hypothetical protein [Myxococcales bacterium]
MRRWVGRQVLGLMLLTACSSGPKYQVDDAILADVPVSEKQAMLSAKSEIDQALEERRKAEADLQVVQRDLSLAEAEQGQAKLEVDKAEAELKLAEQTKDMNRIQLAREQVKRAKLAREVADLKVDWQKQRRKAQRAVVEAAEGHLQAARARFEQEKARLVQQKGKRPSGDFNVLAFDQQAIKMQSRYDEARIEANRQMLQASQKEQAYQQRLTQYQQALGSGVGASPSAAPAPGQPMTSPLR